METQCLVIERSPDVHAYVTGSWIACVGPMSAALVPGEIGAEAALAAWEALDENGLVGFIDALAAATHSTVTSLPAFAVAVRAPDGVRIGVRGAVTAEASADATGAVSGAGVTGWNEALWPLSSEVTLSVAVPEPSATLWIAHGMAMASSITASFGGDAGASSARARAVRAAAEEVPAQAVPLQAVPLQAASVEPAPAPEVYDAVSTETLHSPSDDDESGGPEGGDDDFGVWGWTVAQAPAPSPPAAAPAAGLISAVPPEITAPPPAPLAPPAAPRPFVAAAPPAGAMGDHDGATISVAALRELSAAGDAPPSFATAEQIAKERSGRAIVSTGALVMLDRNVIIGRQPKAARITGEMPYLVAVPSPQQDISRNHLELRVTDSVVVAVDLDTTNGSVLYREGSEPARLHPGEPAILLSNDVIDLGDGITITFEDLP